MKKLFPLTVTLLLVCLFANNARSQSSCADCRYLSPVFDSVIIDTGVHFGKGKKIDGNMQQLYMDIYHPYGDTMKNRPLVVFAFGGAFIKGSKDDWYVVEACKLFAKSGYVAAAIDYRVGIDPLEIIQLQFMRIFFRPMQDMRGAVQYFKADYSERGNTYNIDTNRIIISGASSGGITALMNAYCDKPTEMGQMGNISALNALGGFYSTTGFDTNYSWKSLATVSISGALINSDWVEPGDQPVVMAHGDRDSIVPYADGEGGKGLFGFDASSFGFNFHGSYLVDSVAKAKGVCSYLYTMDGWGHPTEDRGIEYVRSVVYRIMQRMHAVVNNRTFCCPLQVDVKPNDTLFFHHNGGGSTVLSAQIAADSGNAQLHWCSIGCGYTSDAATINFQHDSSYKYIIATVNENQCEQGDLYILLDSSYVPSSVPEIRKVDFSVYPQPAKDEFYLTADLNSYTGKQITVEMFDVTGQKVIAQQILATRNAQTKINTSNLPSGNYFVILKSDKELLGVKKVIVQR